MRPIRALKDIDRRLDELTAEDRAAQEQARFELARSASRFSRRTKNVVDGTMSLSATLMRAGEVEEANRLLQEAEREVRHEEAALIETVNEAKAADEVRKRKLSQLRFVKLVTTAFLSGSMFLVSAFGMAAVHYFTSDDPAVRPSHPPVGPQIAAPKGSSLRELVLAPGVKLRLTAAELRTFARLTNDLNERALRRFLTDRLPTEVVAQVDGLLTMAVQALGTTLSVPVEDPIAVQVRNNPESGDQEANPQGSASPSDDPEPSEQPEPDASPSPEPSPSEKGGEGEGEDGPGNLPFPVPFEDDEG